MTDRQAPRSSDLPLVPEHLLQRHRVHEPFDHRFRAAARLLQALWREDQDLPIGFVVTDRGTRKTVGSAIAPQAGRTGANFITPEIAFLARREMIYCEIGAAYDRDRMLTNLLSSQPLTFNLIGPLRLDLRLATRVLTDLFPELADAEVCAVWFEHSPGRGVPSLTADRSAFDAFIIYHRACGRRGFVAIEVKYAESLQEPEPSLKPRYDELAPQTGMFVDPLGPQLRRNPLQQFFRQHCLAAAMLLRGDYDEGRYLVVAPELNHLVRNAAGAYACQLTEPGPTYPAFDFISITALVDALERAGAATQAAALRRRYLDWRRLDTVIEFALAAAHPGPGSSARTAAVG